MAEVKWIKMATDLFDNRKIRQIEALPDGDSIIVIWVKLLCLAGNINDSGLVYFTKEIPYTEQMLATQFNKPLSTIQLAMKTFEQFGMIEVVDNIFHISNWEKYQCVEKMNEIREYNRLAKQKSRAKQKLLQDVNDMSMTCQPCHDTDIDIDIYKERNTKERKFDTENAEDVLPELRKIWGYIETVYPKKDNLTTAMRYWVKEVESALDPIGLAKAFYNGIKLYIADYDSKHPDKEDANYYRYLKTLDKWLADDSGYWVREASKIDERKKAREREENESNE